MAEQLPCLSTSLGSIFHTLKTTTTTKHKIDPRPWSLKVRVQETQKILTSRMNIGEEMHHRSVFASDKSRSFIVSLRKHCVICKNDQHQACVCIAPSSLCSSLFAKGDWCLMQLSSERLPLATVGSGCRDEQSNIIYTERV